MKRLTTTTTIIITTTTMMMMMKKIATTLSLSLSTCNNLNSRRVRQYIADYDAIYILLNNRFKIIEYKQEVLTTKSHTMTNLQLSHFDHFNSSLLSKLSQTPLRTQGIRFGRKTDEIAKSAKLYEIQNSHFRTKNGKNIKLVFCIFYREVWSV